MRPMCVFLVCLCAATFAFAGNTSEQSSRSKLASLPTVAQSSISSLVARDLREYQVLLTGKGFEARGPRPNLLTSFTANGVEIRTGKLHVGFDLKGYGYGEVRQNTSALPKAKFNRVEYRRGQMIEWYANGPLGLEQGFTINHRPPGANGGALTVAIDLTGEFKASVGGDGSDLTFAGSDGASLRYAGLTATDATGRQLRSWLELEGRCLSLRVADSSAQYPLVIDPLVQLADLTASDGDRGDALGWSIAMSGNTVVVGAINANDYGPGAVYVFVKPASGWANMTQVAKLTGNGLSESEFGYYVAVSGNTIVASKNLNALPSGVLVFVEPAGGWVNMGPTATLTASDGSFAGSVGISGNTIVAGAPGATVNGDSQRGAAYVYVAPEGGWVNMTETAKLTASDGKALDLFGASVGINGNTVVVGAYGVNNQSGAAYVFVEPAAGWEGMTQTARLSCAGAGQQFGWSVAMNSDTVVIGAPYASFGGQRQEGEAYVFVRPPDGWADMTPTASLTAAGAAAFYAFGTSVAVSGSVIVVGAPSATVGGVEAQGAAYVYVKPADGWRSTSHYQYQLSNGGSFAGFGLSVAAAGANVAAGAWDAVNEGPGAAYVFGP
jgi:hypothetical protein